MKVLKGAPGMASRFGCKASLLLLQGERFAIYGLEVTKAEAKLQDLLAGLQLGGPGKRDGGF